MWSFNFDLPLTAFTLLRSFDCRRERSDMTPDPVPRAGNRNCAIDQRSKNGRSKLKLHVAEASGVSSYLSLLGNTRYVVDTNTKDDGFGRRRIVDRDSLHRR